MGKYRPWSCCSRNRSRKPCPTCPCAQSGWQTILKLTNWVCGTNPSTFERESTVHGLFVPETDREGLVEHVRVAEHVRDHEVQQRPAGRTWSVTRCVQDGRDQSGSVSRTVTLSNMSDSRNTSGIMKLSSALRESASHTSLDWRTE